MIEDAFIKIELQGIHQQKRIYKRLFVKANLFETFPIHLVNFFC